MRSVLLAWELGSGFGHVFSLRRIAARLVARGFRCVAAVRDIGAAAPLAEAGIEVIQAPLWKASRSSATLGDLLGDAGLADLEVLRTLLDGWRRIIDQTRPSLVIADYAPAAGLAARGRVPLALVGNGFTLPPEQMPTFTLLHDITPPRWLEEYLLAVTNSVLFDMQLQPLQRLPELFSSDVAWVGTFPMLDPYAAWRRQPAEGPPMARWPMPRTSSASEILVYLSSWRGAQPSFLEAFRSFAPAVRLFGTGLSAAARETCEKIGIRLESEPFNLERDLANAALLVHLGSEGTAHAGIAAGVPQLVCATDVEKELNGKALTKAGVGKFIPIYDPAVALNKEMITTLLADAGAAERARQIAAAHHAQYAQADQLTDFEAACMRLLQ